MIRLMLVVAGIVNVETSVSVECFPVGYEKSRFRFHGITDRLGGVGYNVAACAASLGAPVRFLTHVGMDLMGGTIMEQLSVIGGIELASIAREGESLRSTILVDEQGRGAMLTDLKDAQERVYPKYLVPTALKGATHLHATNINWALEIAQHAVASGIPVSTDVQAIRDLGGDVYNKRFLDVADIIFLSGENLDCSPGEAISFLLENHRAGLVVCTMGADGLWAGERGSAPIHIEAHRLDRVANATGAGDSFVGGFLRARHHGMPLMESLRVGMRVATLRITSHTNRWPTWEEI